MKHRNTFSLITVTLSLLLCSCISPMTPTDTTGGSAYITAPDIGAITQIPTLQTTPVQTDAPQTQAPVIEVEYTYLTDIDDYLEYIDPEDSDAYLVLVNKDNPLDEDYVPDNLVDLVDTRDDGRDDQQMVEAAAMALEAFLIEAREAGCKDVTVTSGYRSYARQDYLFNIYANNAQDPDEMSDNFRTEESLDALVDNLVSCLGIDRSDAQDIADKIEDGKKLTEEQALLVTRIESCEAGTSEHQSGLCVDMHNLGSARPEFAETDEAKWLEENCVKFGFIIRFPEDKTNVTGIVYEPWHFRFVGRYHAQRMSDLNMCLEEYTEYLKNE